MQGQFKEKPVIPFYFQARESPVSATSASPRKPQGIPAQTLRSNNNNRKTEERRNWYRKFAFEKVQGFLRFPLSFPRFQSFVLLLSPLFVMHFIALKTLDSPMKPQQIPHIILISMNHDSVRIQKEIYQSVQFSDSCVSIASQGNPGESLKYPCKLYVGLGVF